MNEKISLKEAERKVFQSTHSDGLWDVFIGCIFLEFAIAPLLSIYLGDFWSSAVFIPFWGLAFLAIWLVRKNVVIPRIGKVSYGKTRVKKLKTFTVAMLITNTVIFVMGIVAALTVGRISGSLISGVLGLFLITGFSFAAYILDYPRLYIYGLLLFVGPWVGEWLFQNQLASHHGFPIVFGSISGLMIVVGLLVFTRFVQMNPKPDLPIEEI